MKVKFGVVMLLFFMATSCVKSQNDKVQVVNATIFEEKMKEEGVQLIDVRTPQEFASGHLPNAVNINISDPDFEKKMQGLDKNKPVLVYCKSGGRSGRACSQLKDLEFTTIIDIDGGITDWQASGKPIEN